VRNIPASNRNELNRKSNIVSRITPLNPDRATGNAKQLLSAVQASLPLLAVAYGSRSLFQAKRNWLAALSGKAKPVFGVILICVAVGIISSGDKKLEAALLRHLPESWVDLTTRY
jgi:cytochrome c-type biogenesis protein